MKIECTPAERAVIEKRMGYSAVNGCSEIEWVDNSKSISVPIEYNIGDLMIGNHNLPNLYELTTIYENGRAPNYELRLRELFTDKTRTMKYNIKENMFADGSRIIRVNNKPFKGINLMEVELI